MDWTVFWAAAGVIVAAAVPTTLYFVDRRTKPQEESDYTIEGNAWLLERGLTYDALLHRLIDIDYLALAGAGLSDRSEGTIEQWAPVFEKSPETWSLVVFRDSLVVGYWSFFSLSPQLIGAIERGRIYDSQITADHVRRVTDEGTHSFYCPMIARHPDFPHAKRTIFKYLMKSLAEAIEQLTSEGVQISGVYANSLSSEGENLCRALGMRQLCPSKQGGYIFRGDVTDLSVHRIARLKSR